MNFKEENSDFYDQEYFIGMEFRYLSEAHGNKITMLKKFVGDVGDKKILDLGCGSGIFSYLLSKEGADVVGVDYSKPAIEFAKSRYSGVDFMLGSIYDLSDFSDQTFDIVVMMDIVEHLGDQGLAMKEAVRLVKRGGWVVVSTDLQDSYWEKSLLNRFVWFSMRFSKEGRAFRMIKEVESKIKNRKVYTSSHIGLLDYEALENLVGSFDLKIIRHEVFPLVRVGWRDFVFQILPKKARGEHQMVIAEKVTQKLDSS